MSDAITDFVSNDDGIALKGRAVKGAFYTTVAQVFRAIISVMSQILLSRLLMPAEFGIMAMVSPVLAFISLFNSLGLSQAVIQRPDITQADVSMLYWLGLIVSSSCAVLAIAVSPLIAMLYHKPEVAPVLIALAIQMPIGALAGHASALLTRSLRFDALALIEVIAALTGLGASVMFALLKCGYWSLVLGQVCQTGVQAASEWSLSGWRPSRPKWSPDALPMIRFGAGLTGFNLISMFSLYCDNVLVGILRGASALGLFDRAFGLVLRPLSSITAPVSRIATPILSRMVRDPPSYTRAYIAMFQALVLLGAPGMLVGAFMAKPVIVVLLGERWLGAAPILSPICVAAMFTGLSGSTYWLFTSQDRIADQIRGGLISSGLILVSMLVGVSRGPVGIALSYAAFAPLIHGCFIWIATRRGPIRLPDVLRGLTPLVTSLAIAAGLMAMSCTVLQTFGLIGIISATLLSYGVTLTVMIFFPSGRTLMKIGFDMIGRRVRASALSRRGR